jgi:hypothetical protein
VKAHFVPDLARGGHGNEARAASAGTAAARRAALANFALHEVAHWCIHANVQPRRLAPAMAAADAPVPSTAIPGTAGHVCTAVSWDFVSERSVWPATLDLAGELVEGRSVPPAGPYATLHGRAIGRSAVSGACILVPDPGGAGKSRLAAAYACKHGIETVPAGTSRQFVDADMCVPFRGALLPAVWQPELSGPESRGFEVAAQPAPAAASVPNGVAGWTGVSGLLCADNGMCAPFSDIEMLRNSGDGVPSKNGMTGSVVSDPDRWGLQENTALFSLLGTTYGGDGESTFALPDLRGRTAVQGSGSGHDFVFYCNGDTLIGSTVNDAVTGGAGNDIAFRGLNGSDTIADFSAATGQDNFSLLNALWQQVLIGTHAVASPRPPDVALTRSKDAALPISGTGWKTDAATRLHEGPLINWDAAAARRKSDVVSCEITDLFEDDTTACIFPRRARDLFYGREIAPGDNPVGAADVESGTGVINFASRKSKKKAPGDIADAAAAR